MNMNSNELKIQKTKEEKIKEFYIRYQMLKQQLNGLISQKSLLEKNIEMIRETIENINDISSIKEGQQIFSSVGSGVYVKAELKDCKNVIINIGSEIMIEKPIPQAILILEKKIEEIKKLIEEINKQITIFEKEIEKIEKEIVEASKGGIKEK